VPLSEEEQRVLDEIERNFYGSDPDLARAVSAKEPKAKRPSSGFAVGVGAMVMGLLIVTFGYTTSPIIGLLGVIAMIWGGSQLWRTTAERWNEVANRVKVDAIRDRFPKSKK
jgi:hypothetical protein